jgi:hypothetical protein
MVDEAIAIFPVLSVDNIEEALPPFSKWLSEKDGDRDGRLTLREMPLAGLFDRDGILPSSTGTPCSY